MSQYTPKLKKHINPITLTITVEATRINESGTLLGFVVKKMPKGFKLSAPPQGGGSIYIRLEDGMSLKDAGIELLEDAVKAPAETRKLF
jgi:hypothetical protein